jgi:hypothetical protein
MNDAAPDPVADARERARARTEAKNQAVRDTLEPLEPGERPLAVTIASIVAMVLAIGNLLAYILNTNATGAEDQTAIPQLAFICGALALASVGMWFAKYWAVLGFQTILGLQIIVYSLAITRAERISTVLLFLVIIIGSSILFWFLIRAMARIQMPEPPLPAGIDGAGEDDATGDAGETVDATDNPATPPPEDRTHG